MDRVAISNSAIEWALRESRGFIWPAARLLGVSRMALYRRVIRFGYGELAKKLRAETGWKYGTARIYDPAEELRKLEAVDYSTLKTRRERQLYCWRRGYWRKRLARERK